MMINETLQNFKGRLIALKRDHQKRPIKVSLYTPSGEDILLEFLIPVKQLRYLINENVKIRGKILSDDGEGKRVLAKSITKDWEKYVVGILSVTGEEDGFEEYHVSDLISLPA